MKDKMKMSSIKNIILISKNNQKMKSDTIPGTSSKSVSLCFWRFVPLFVRLPIPRFLSHSYFKMVGCRTRADVATLPRREVETSRRGDVATWRRRDVAVTSMLYSSLLQKLLPQLLYSLHCTYIQNRHQIMSLATKTV